MASECRAQSMYKKCRKFHHTLLHIKADTKTKDKRKVSKEMTDVASSKLRGEVLLMTCRVKVIAPNGTVTPARALLDSAASTSLISQGLARDNDYRVAVATQGSTELQVLASAKMEMLNPRYSVAWDK